MKVTHWPVFKLNQDSTGILVLKQVPNDYQSIYPSKTVVKVDGASHSQKVAICKGPW